MSRLVWGICQKQHAPAQPYSIRTSSKAQTSASPCSKQQATVRRHQTSEKATWHHAVRLGRSFLITMAAKWSPLWPSGHLRSKRIITDHHQITLPLFQSFQLPIAALDCLDRTHWASPSNPSIPNPIVQLKWGRKLCFGLTEILVSSGQVWVFNSSGLECSVFGQGN